PVRSCASPQSPKWTRLRPPHPCCSPGYGPAPTRHAPDFGVPGRDADPQWQPDALREFGGSEPDTRNRISRHLSGQHGSAYRLLPAPSAWHTDSLDLSPYRRVAVLMGPAFYGSCIVTEACLQTFFNDFQRPAKACAFLC